MTINERIINIIDFLKIDDSEFGKQIGVGKQYIYLIKRKNYSVGKKFVQRILDRYPEFNPMWIWYEEGNMLLINENTLEDSLTKYNSTMDTKLKEQMIYQMSMNIQTLTERVNKLEETMEQVLGNSKKNRKAN